MSRLGSFGPKRRVGAGALFVGALTSAAIAFASDERLSHLSKVSLGADAEEVLVRIVGSRSPDFTSFTMKDPFRVVVDWSGSSLRGVPAEQTFPSGLVEEIRAQQFSSESEKISRVTIALRKETSFRFETAADQVVVRFANVAIPPPPPTPVVVAAAEPVAELPEGPMTEPAEPPPAPAPKPKAAPPPPAPVATPVLVQAAPPPVLAAPEPKTPSGEPPPKAAQIAAATEIAKPKETPAIPVVAAKPVVEPKPVAEAKPAVAAVVSPEPTKVAKVEPTKVEAKAEPKLEAKVEPAKAEPKLEPATVAKVETKAEPKLEPATVAKVEPAKVAEAKAEPKVAEATKVEPAKVAEAKVEPAKVEAKAEPKVAEAPKVAPAKVAEVAPAPAKSAPEPKPATLASFVPKAKPMIAQAPAADGDADADPGPRKLTYVGFRAQPNTSEVFVRLDGKARYKVEQSQGRYTLVLLDTSVPSKNNTRHLDTSFFQSAVLRVQAVPTGANTRVEIDVRDQVPYEVKRTGNTISFIVQNGTST